MVKEEFGCASFQIPALKADVGELHVIGIAPARNEKISVSGSNASGKEGKNYKDTPGFAMNRNDIIQSLLTQLKPDWLVIGSPVVAEAPASKDEISNWKGLECHLMDY